MRLHHPLLQDLEQKFKLLLSLIKLRNLQDKNETLAEIRANTEKFKKNVNLSFKFVQAKKKSEILEEEKNSVAFSHLLFKDAVTSGFPTSKDGSSCNAVYCKGEGSHSKVAIVGFAHFLHIFKPFGHVSS